MKDYKKIIHWLNKAAKDEDTNTIMVNVWNRFGSSVICKYGVDTIIDDAEENLRIEAKREEYILRIPLDCELKNIKINKNKCFRMSLEFTFDNTRFEFWLID